MHRELSPTTSWCRRISNGCTSSSLRQRASQKSRTICESWSRRSGRSWCTSCRQGCHSPVDLLRLAADEGRADDCSPNCCRPKADQYGRGKEANRKQQSVFLDSDEGRRGTHSQGRLRGLSVEADLGAQVHRDHPPLSRGRLEHAGRSPRQRNRRPLARGTSNIELEASSARVSVWPRTIHSMPA